LVPVDQPCGASSQVSASDVRRIAAVIAPVPAGN
jgi:hypothetical protein